MVRQDLGKEGGVARHGLGDRGECVIVGRKDSLVAVGKRREEGRTFGGVGDARGDLDERGQASTTVYQLLYLDRLKNTYVRAPRTVWR